MPASPQVSQLLHALLPSVGHWPSTAVPSEHVNSIQSQQASKSMKPHPVLEAQYSLALQSKQNGGSSPLYTPEEPVATHELGEPQGRPFDVWPG